MSDKKNNFIKKAARLSPLAMLAVMAVIYFAFLKGLTAQQLISYTPEEPFAAAAVIILMYALKSMSYFFPMLIIAVVCGAILPLYAAIPVNLIGIAVMATIPYCIGRFSQGESETADPKKNKHIEKIRRFATDNQYFSSFLLRIINVLPYDIVSLVLGSMRFSYKKYIIGSIIGTAPGIILTTVMGSAITEPGSPEFITSVSIEAVLIICSLIIYHVCGKRH